MSFRNLMPKLFWLSAAFLSIIIIGTLYQSLQLSPEIRDKTSLVELTLDDHIEELLLTNYIIPESGLILLYTPNLNGLRIPPSVRGVPLRVLTQDQIDKESLSRPLDYFYYERIERSNSFTAEVEMTFEWLYQVGVIRLDSTSGVTYYCTKKTDQWVIYMAEYWEP